MTKTKLFLALGASLAATALAGAQSSYTVVPGMSGVDDITPDGTIICGSGGGGGYYWKWQTDPNPTLVGGLGATGISADGTAMCGNMTDPMTGAQIAGRWTQATGWVSIGALPNAMQCPSLSSAYDISDDGTLIVGLSWDGCDGRGFIWQLGVGISQLENLASGQNRASTIAGDGSLIGGFAQSSSRTPAIWTPAGTGTVYDLTVFGEVWGSNSNGSRIVGQWNGTPFYMDNPATGTPVSIPSAIPGWSGQATATSDSGDRVVGFDSQLLDRSAWVWESSTDTTTLLKDALAAAGVPNLPFNIGVATCCSSDGSTIGGQTFFGDTYIAVLGDCATGSANFCTAAANSEDPGGALIGSNGMFDISDNLFSLNANPVPNQPGIFYFGADQVNGGNGIPFGNGFRCVTGSSVYRLPVGTGSGNVLAMSIDFTVAPATLITPGSTWNFQAWYRDPAAGGANFNLSDGLEVTFCD